MRIHGRRKTDATYELNLAPFLDIIVSIVPMLLLSVVFMQIRMIETSVPQVVAQKIKEQQENKKPEVTVALKVKATGFDFVVTEKGKPRTIPVQLKEGKLDYEGLAQAALQVKRQHIDIFSMDLLPEATVAYNDIVKTMDVVRRAPASADRTVKPERFKVKDDKTGEVAETDLMFPDVTFANVVE